MYDQWVGKTLLNCLRNAAAGWYRRSRPSRASAAFAFSPPPELVGVLVELMISAPRTPDRLFVAVTGGDEVILVVHRTGKMGPAGASWARKSAAGGPSRG